MEASTTIGFFGGLVGIIIGYLLGKLINLAIFVYFQAQKVSAFKGAVITTPWWLMFFALIFTTTVGLLLVSCHRLERLV